MPDLTAQQIAILERLRERGFQIVAFPMYANYIAVRRGDCAGLLTPVSGNGLQVFGEPTYLLAGNFSVRVTRAGQRWFVWKNEKLEATPARLDELRQFAAEIAESLLPST